MEELGRWEAENRHRLPKADAEGLGRRKLTVVTA
jgi:(E)-4-hydroxy-3-methylbut-2-enyl-diphosphate synthase